MKKLSETTANELIYRLSTEYEFSLTKDCVLVTFYNRRKVDYNMIGKFYTSDCIGEWLIEKHVKAFTVSYHESDDGTKMVDVDIVVTI